jgi:hypothetical protein
MTEPHPTADGRTVTVRVPISIRKRGGQKLVLAADGTINTWAPPSRRIDNAMVKAVARAFRWCEMLETVSGDANAAISNGVAGPTRCFQITEGHRFKSPRPTSLLDQRSNRLQRFAAGARRNSTLPLATTVVQVGSGRYERASRFHIARMEDRARPRQTGSKVRKMFIVISNPILQCARRGTPKVWGILWLRRAQTLRLRSGWHASGRSTPGLR